MKLSFALITILIIALGTLMFSGTALAFFNEIASSLGNKIISAKTFAPPASNLADHLIINEVLYDATEAQDIYKQASKNRGQWIEVYNPTSSSLDVNGWSIEDDSIKQRVELEGVIPPGGFILVIGVSKADFISLWNVPSEVLFVESTSAKIGNGLDAFGDRLVLKNKDSQIIDKMSWGKDTSGFTPECNNLCSTAPAGESLERSPVANDTDSSTDFVTRKTPTPGGI